MFNRIDRANLQGKAVLGSVDEPWGFISVSGDNRLTGVISSVSECDVADGWIKLSVAPFLFEGTKVSEVLCVSRFYREEHLPTILAKGQRATVNMHFKTDGKPFAIGYVNNRKVREPKTSFFIGSIWLASQGWDLQYK